MTKRVWLMLVLFVLMLVAGGYWQAVHWLHQRRQVVQTTLVIAPGTSGHQVIRQLADAGVIDHPWLLRVYARWQGIGSRMQSGWYRFNGSISPVAALNKIVDGAVMAFQLTVPEGLRSAEILPLLAQESGVAVAQWRAAWQQLGGKEGVLLPDSWRYTRPLHPRALLQRMMEAQQQLLASVEPDPNQWQRLRIVASIIEKETAMDAERPIISAVIRNRLQRNMPLQMDPTIIYGLYQIDGHFSGDITRRDLKRDTPWNTYLHKGLPPTPICHPGRASLIAAARPTASQALYFVANGKGGHNFARSLVEHRKNVADLLRRQRQ